MKHLFICILLLTLLMREFFYFQERHIYKENEPFKLSYSILHEPKKNTISQYFFADGVMVTTALYPSYHYGEKILIDGKVAKKLTKKGSLLVVENPKITRVENHNLLLSFSKVVRQKVEGAVLYALPGREAGLLLGVILGVRDKIDNEYYEMLRNAGVLHVIAASGQNISIAAAMLLLIFDRITIRRVALLLTSLGVLVYAVLTGFDPPIVRASVMAILAFAALFSGRQANGVYILFLTAWGMLIYQPQELEDVSFQLSFLSTFGILSVKPLLDRVLVWKHISLIRDDITTTLSAQIATFPIMLASFGAYSLLSFPINILILWTVPVIMIFGGLGGILSTVFAPLAVPFILLCYPFLSYFTGVVVFFSSFHYQLSVDNVPILVLVGYYLMFLAIVIRYSHFKFEKK